MAFRDGPDECSFECSSVYLGALMKEMRAKRLDPKPETPLLCYSVVASMNAARSMRSPQWVCQKRNAFGQAGFMSRFCNPRSIIQSKMDGLEEMMGGLTLNDFDGRRSLGHPRAL